MDIRVELNFFICQLHELFLILENHYHCGRVSNSILHDQNFKNCCHNCKKVITSESHTENIIIKSVLEL